MNRGDDAGERQRLEDADRLALATEQWQKESPDFDVGLFQMASALSMLGQALEIEFRALAQRVGGDLGTGDLRILLMLRRSGYPFAQRPVDLVRYLLVTSGAITKQIARLEAKGLIERSRIEDKRGWRIQLTEAGSALAMAAMHPGALPLFSATLRSFPREEQNDAVRFLRKLLGRLERRRAVDGQDMAAPID